MFFNLISSFNDKVLNYKMMYQAAMRLPASIDNFQKHLTLHN